MQTPRRAQATRRSGGRGAAGEAQWLTCRRRASIHGDTDEPPGDEEPFEATDDLPACADGDWPPSPMYLMNQELPGEVLAEFAETYSTNFNGDFSTIPSEQADNVLARLTELGFPLREDPRVGDLIRE